MKKIILLVFIFQHFVSVSQDTFIKEIDANFFGQASIIATDDKGWLILAEESLQLSKYNECGEFQWSKKYDIINQGCCTGNQMVLGSWGEIYLLSREAVNQHTGFRITALETSGFVLWSKYYAETDLDYHPYSLLMDSMGDLLVFANSIGVGAGHSTLTKLDVNGEIKWSKKYDNGNIWGEAIVTQDLGVLMRRGDSFIKVDSAGLVEWATRVTFNNTYYYHAPVEVSDGYVFTTQNRGSQEIVFYKLDKQGNLLGDGRQLNLSSSVPNPLRNTPNGNFTTILHTNRSSPSASSIIIEMDKDLNMVKQNAIRLKIPEWFINDLWLSKANIPLVVGKTSTPTSQHFVFGKLDNDYKLGCDTIIPTSFTLVPASFASETVGVSSNTLTPVYVLVNITNATLNDDFTCSQTNVKVLTLGKDTVICPDTSITLQNRSADDFSHYTWSTGETTPTIAVNSSGTYWVRSANLCVSAIYTDTIVVGVKEIQDPSLPTDTVLCGGNTLLLNAEIPMAQYLWQDQSTSPTFLVSEPGNYFVDITSNSCVLRFYSKILACEDYIIPNIFTPNGDGLNDYFEVLYFGIKPFACKVYNRWGVLQYETNNARFHWDGTLNGAAVSDGVYVYLIKIGNENLKGTVTIVR